MTIQVYRGVLSEKVCRKLYDKIVYRPKWLLGNSSVPEDKVGKFAGRPLGQRNEYDDGPETYWEALLDTISTRHQAITGEELPTNLLRCMLNAQNQSNVTKPHIDSPVKGAMSVLGMLTPDWDPDWGGEFVIDGQEIPYEAGKFIVFPAGLEHYGKSPNQKTPRWRTTLNYILWPDEAVEADYERHIAERRGDV